MFLIERQGGLGNPLNRIYTLNAWKLALQFLSLVSGKLACMNWLNWKNDRCTILNMWTRRTCERAWKLMKHPTVECLSYCRWPRWISHPGNKLSVKPIPRESTSMSIPFARGIVIPSSEMWSTNLMKALFVHTAPAWPPWAWAWPPTLPSAPPTPTAPTAPLWFSFCDKNWWTQRNILLRNCYHLLLLLLPQSLLE